MHLHPIDSLRRQGGVAGVVGGVAPDIERVVQGDAAKREHRLLYRRLRRDRPGVYGHLGSYRRASDLAPHRKLLYPVVYGARPRFTFENHVKRWLDRVGLWTLRR